MNINRAFLIILLFLSSRSVYSQTVTTICEADSGVQQGAKMVHDEDGNIYLFGKFTESLSTGNLQVTSNGSFDMYLAKLNAYLQPQWMINIGSAGDDGAGDISYYSGKLYLTGWYGSSFFIGNDTMTFDATNNIYAGLLIEVDTSGTILKSKSFNNVDNIYGYITAIDVNSTGIALGGTIKGTITLGNGVAVSTSLLGTETDILVAKLDFNFNAQWGFSRGSSAGIQKGSDGASDIVMDDSGAIYVSGFFGSMPNLNSGSMPWGIFNLVADGGFGFSDYFIANVNSNGTLGWAHASGGSLPDVASRMCLKNDTILIVAGRYSDFSDIAGIALTPSPNDYSKFIGVLNTNGSGLHAYRINSGTTFYSLKCGDDGYIYGADATTGGDVMNLYKFETDSGIVFSDSIYIGNTSSYSEIDILPPGISCGEIIFSSSTVNYTIFHNDTLVNHPNTYVDLLLGKYSAAGNLLSQPVISSSTSSYCNNSTSIVISAINDPNANTYHWDVVPVVAGVFSGNSNSINFIPDTNYNGTLSILCYTTNFCNLSALSDTLHLTALQAPDITSLQLLNNSVEALVANSDSSQWLLNASPLPLYNNLYSIPCQGTGTYQLIAMNQNGCTDTAFSFISCTSGIPENEKYIVVYPQPADEYFIINGLFGEFTLYNYSGEIIKTENFNNRFDTTELISGLYTYRITSGDKILTGKLMIMH